jgi:hypothetical protein
MADNTSWRKRICVILCCFQGIYFAVTGIWPLVSIQTFQAVTGRKTDHLVTGSESDHWLVKIVGVLVTANAVVLLAAAWRRRISIDVATLAVASGIGLAAIDLIYVFRGTISAVYLFDAALEIVFVVTWAWAWRSMGPSTTR